jgi:Ni/Co efflux regulator RcnB
MLSIQTVPRKLQIPSISIERPVPGVLARCAMNRFLGATLSVLLAIAAVDATAQGRGRDEGRVAEASGEGQSKENGYRGGGDHGRGGGRDGGGRSERGGELAPQQYGRGQGEARGQVYGLGQFVDGSQGRGSGGQGNRDGGRNGGQSYADGGRGNGGRGHGNSGWDNNGRGHGNGGWDNNGRGHGNGGWDNNGRGHGNRGWDNNGRGYSNHGRGYGDGRHGYSGWNNYGRGYSNHRHGWRDHNWRRSWNHGWNGSRYRSPSRYHYPRGYRSSYWSIGLILPSAYYAPSYYVDYRYYGLSAPPWGCHWVRVENDVLLIDIQTGEVVDILYGFFY